MFKLRLQQNIFSKSLFLGSVLFFCLLVNPVYADVVESYTDQDNYLTVGDGGDTTANEYYGMIFYLENTTTIDSITFRTPSAQDCGGSGAESYDTYIFDMDGNILASNLNQSDPGEPGNNEEYIIDFEDIEVAPGYYVYGMHYDSGIACTRGRNDHGGTYNTGGYVNGCQLRNEIIGDPITFDATTCVLDNTDVYFKINGTSAPAFGPSSGFTGTAIEFNYPLEGTVTASVAVPFSLSYRLNSSTHDTDVYTSIALQACTLITGSQAQLSGKIDDSCEFFTFQDTITPDTIVSESFTFELAYTGPYLVTANFWNGVSENVDCPWWKFWCDDEQIIMGEGDAVQFIVASTTVSFNDIFNRNNQRLVTAGFCDTGTPVEWWEVLDQAQRQMCKVINLLFFPSDTVGSNFAVFEQLGQLASNRVPFAYYFSVSSASHIFNPSSFETATEFDVTIGFFGTSLSLPFDGFASSSLGGVVNDFGDTYIVPFSWLAFIVYVLSFLTGMSKIDVGGGDSPSTPTRRKRWEFG